MAKRIGAELIEAMSEALDHAKGKHTDSKVHKFTADDVRLIRAGLKMSQAEFAHTFHLELKTLQKWESGERRPTGPAAAFLRVIRHAPKTVKKALSDAA